MRTIEGVEIFAIGTWNGMKFTHEDLQQIADNTNALLDKGRNKPPLKLGHSEAQILAGQEDGDPALGWVENIQVKGDKLVADFVNVPDIVVNTIEAGLFRQISVEMRPIEHLGWILTATAILGADIPAVKTLEDLQAFLSDNYKGIPQSNSLAACFSTTEPILIFKGNTMPEEIKADFSDERAKFNQEIADLKAKNDQYKQVETERVFADKKEETLKVYKTDVEAGKLAPSILPEIEGFLNAQKVSFSDTGVFSFTPELTQKIGLAYSETLPVNETASNESKEEIKETVDFTIEKEAAKLQAQHNIGYTEACDLLFKAQPELLSQWKDLTVEISGVN